MRVYLAIIASLLLHFLIQYGMQLYVPAPVSKRDATEVTFFTRQVQNPQEKKLFVKDPEVQDDKAPRPQKVRFWSLTNRYVEKEQKAAANGVTQNRVPTTQQKQTEKNQKPNQDDFFKPLVSRDLRQLNQGTSSLAQQLPQDIKVGSFTSLNTEYNSHYSFFARIEDLIYLRWVERVHAAMKQLEGKNLPYNRNNEWFTEVEILIDRTGQYQKTLVLKTSNVSLFDQAIGDAFRDANIIPNPPQDLVQPDGFLHLGYRFNVKYSPTQVVTR